MPLPFSLFTAQTLPVRSWFGRLARWLLGMCLGFAIGIGVTYALSAMQDASIKRSVDRVEHTHEVIKALETVLNDADDVETGQRGFLLTGEASYLEPYRQGLASIWGHFARASELTRDNVRQQDRLQVLQALLHARLMVSTQVVELAEAGDRQQAVEIVKSGRGRRLMDLARQTLAAAVADEQALLEVRRADWENVQVWWNHLVLGLVSCGAAGVAMGGIALTRLIAGRTAARQAAAAAAERQRLIERMDLAAILVRDFDGPIRAWTRGCQRLYGWTAEQAVGQSSHALLNTVSPTPLAEIEAALMRDRTWTGELHQRTQDGREVIVAAHKMMLREADGRLTVMESVTDITALRQAQTALRDSQAELGSVFDTAAECIVVAQADGRITSVNRAALRIFGYETAEELLGRDLGVLMPAAEAMRHGAYVAAHRGGAPPRVIGVPGRELVAIRHNGSEFPIELSVSSFVRDGRRYLTGIIRDITARKQAEATLRESEARLRLVQAVGGIASVDRPLPDGEALVSGEFARIYGLPAGQNHLSAAESLALVHPDDRARIKLEAGDAYQTGGRFDTEFRICRSDGTLRWVAMHAEVLLGEDGKPNRVISAQRDITDIVTAREEQASRAAELERHVNERTAELAKAEARFRAIFDSQFQFIGLLAPDGTTLELNRTALEAAGLAHEDAIGRPFWNLGWWPAAERGRLQREIIQAGQGAVIRREVTISGADGRAIWLDFSLKPMRDAGTGKVVWIIPEGRDITEQRNLSSQLVQAQKVNALGQLAGGIAHDFNNILQAVEGAATLIERRPEDVDRTRRLARMAIDATGRGGSITRRLLSFARRDELRTEALPTAELLGNIREVLAHTLGTAIAVQSIVPPDVPSLMADRGQLETALVNLGTNARDAMPNGGKLTLAAEIAHVAARGDARHPVGLAPGAYVRLSVADTGTGMDAATLAQATDPFFTTKPLGHGTGLGLPMVKTLVEQSGGAMSITSTPGAGTTVALWLPQARNEQAPARCDTHGGTTALDGSVRVLLVDDDDMVRETLAAQLEDLGFTILVASGGAEAVALLEAGEAVDAMVSDLSMPDMDGVTTIQKARILSPKLPCFLLTGYVGERATLAAGDAFTLIRKPISAQALAARIETELETTRP
jgi:PAS domain S-box-containing protein